MKEAADLAALATALPDSWIVQVSPPHGQVQMLPRRYAYASHRCWVADGALRLVYRDDGIRGVRPGPSDRL